MFRQNTNHDGRRASLAWYLSHDIERRQMSAMIDVAYSLKISPSFFHRAEYHFRHQ